MTSVFFYVFISTIFYVTCVENTKIPYVELFYLPFEVKNNRIFLFKRASQAKLVKFFLNFGLSRAFLPISEVNSNRKIVTKHLEENLKY